MEICIESQSLNHHQRSGLMTYTEGLVNGLYQHDKANDYTLLYYSLRRLPESMPGPSGERFCKKTIRIPDREFPGRRWMLDRMSLPKFLQQKRIRVFHRPTGYTMPEGKGIFKILTVHDLRTLTMKDQILKQDIGQYRKALNAVDICTVVSECTRRDLLNYFDMDERKIRVTYLGADERFRPADLSKVAEVKRKYQLNEPYFLSVGSVPRKNLEGVLKAFGLSKFRDQFQLAVCCNWEYEKYKTMAEEMGLKGRVRFFEKVQDEEVASLYSGCHAFVFPSFYEGFGLPILEAMQCGAAVITSNISSCPEVAGDAGILVDPQNVGEITEAIDQLASNEGLRTKLIEKGFEQAKLFSWQKFANEMREIYEMA